MLLIVLLDDISKVGYGAGTGIAAGSGGATGSGGWWIS